MSQVITKRNRISRRIFLKGLTAAHAPIVVGVPPLISMFNSTGTAYAAETKVPASAAARTLEKRYVLWFNGNGIPERYWIPSKEGADYDMTPCLSPIARLRDDVLVLSGLDNTHGGNGHPQSLCALMTCTPLTANGPGGSVDRSDDGAQDRRQFAVPLAADRRVSGIVRRRAAEEHELGGSEPAAAARRDSAPLVRPAVRRQGRGLDQRKRSILDAVRQDAALLRKGLPKEDRAAARRASVVDSRPRARDRCRCRRSTRRSPSRSRTST